MKISHINEHHFLLKKGIQQFSASSNQIFTLSKSRMVKFIRSASLFLFALVIAQTTLNAQQVFDRKVTTVNNIGLAITNVGTIGKPDVRDNPGGDPSFEFPSNSGQEHLFEAGIWIGAQYAGTQQRLSSSAVTNPTGYSTGRSGYEFTNDGSVIQERSSLTNSPLFSPLATSHQDFVTTFSDRRIAIETGGGSIPIGGHEQPIFADVTLESYNWNFSFAEAFSILKYTITNTSDADWDSIYVGMYADLVNRNVNSTVETGGQFFNKNGLGYIDSLYTIYVFDAGSQDYPSLNTYGGISLMGAEYDGNVFHPSNQEYLQQVGLRAPVVRPSYWLFSGGAGIYQNPGDDVNRYARMADPNVFTYTEDIAEKLRTDGQSAQGNYISFISIGPFQKLRPGESFSVYFSYVAGLKPQEFQNGNSVNTLGKRADNAASQTEFVENIGWAYRTFRGEDVNGNGVLDAGEDLNGNNQLDRYLVPEPPAPPKMRVELDAGKATIYWDKSAEESVDPVSGEQDFEGYRVYKSSLGDDLDGSIATGLELIAEYDSTGNSVGFNSGFDDIALSTPVTFPDDDTEYWYQFEVDDLLSGWQYAFSVTAFDGGSTTVNLASLESSANVNAVRVFPGTRANANFENGKVGVYPNPYRVNAAWDGGNDFNRKLMFYNLPPRAEVRIYTLAGEVVGTFTHNSDTYVGESRWFNDFSADNRIMSGGEHAWDLLSDARQNLTTGLYLYTVKDLDSDNIQRGKFVIIK